MLAGSFTWRQGRDYAKFVRIVVIVVGCMLLAADTSAKQALRVLYVCTQDASCDAFGARLKGQTSDLRVQIVRVSRGTPPLAEALDDAVSEVDRMAAAHEAEVALWWRDDDVVALLRQPPPGRVLVRNVGHAGKPRHHAGPGTAELEAGSLIGRTAIVAALNGTPLGVPRQAPPAATGAEAMVTAAPPVVAPTTRPTLAPAPWRPVIALGANTAWDGLPKDPSLGWEARAGATYRGLRLTLLWVERPAAEITRSEARGSLASRQLGATVGFDVWRFLKLTTNAEIRGGWVHAQLVPLSGPFPDKHSFARKFAGLALHVRYALMKGRLSAWAGGSLDWVENPFNVGLRSVGGYQALWYMSAIQPGLAVGLEMLFPRYL